ncbi:finger protein [Colletotrichum plurivorum]|uniref:Finger protein n=1 Tax=Colletotrichum plurivorum TaxID=2175906 RepID=A0A8H6JUY1_9PEZI|nr:finger protein [Colletotrichum plurivorum]
MTAHGHIWLTTSRRKTRCSGSWPCIFCAHLQLECQFTASYRRGQLLPAIDLETEGSELGHTDPSLEANSTSGRRNSHVTGDSGLYNDVTPSQSAPTATVDAASVLTSRSMPQHDPGSHSADGPNGQAQRQTNPVSIRNSPEPSQTDEQGHYVGPASGVSFLLRIQRKLQVQSPGYFNSSVFNFGDRPLPGHDSSFAILPPKPLAEAMVRRYFDFAATTHRFLHRPSIEAWLEELYDTDGAMLYKESARSRTALLFMVFAHSNNYRGQSTKDSIAESSEIRYTPPEYPILTQELIDLFPSARFFAVAEHQLSMEKGEIRLPHVQARLAQCFYLLAQSRLNHCWTLFGVTAHLALTLGIHRRSRVDTKMSSRLDRVDLECRKRTFWCAYNLNTYLGAALGRPMTFHDEDIDQELPLCVDDEQLRPGPSAQPVVCGPSIASAMVAQIKLSRILARILRALYGIRQPSTEEHFTFASGFMQDLTDWREHISYLLDAGGSAAIFVKLVLRQRDVLKLAYWHAQILVHRPFLLKSFTTLAGDGADGEATTRRKQEMEANIKTCVGAATNIAEHIDQIDAAGEFYSTLFFIPYYGFSAVVILYVYAIQQRAEAPETYLSSFRLASRCHAHIEAIAVKGSLMQRYGVVLQELRLEVLRNNNYLASVSAIRAGEAPAGGEGVPAQRELLHNSRESGQRGQQYGDYASSMPKVDQGQDLGDAVGGGRPSNSVAANPVASMDVLDGGFFHITNWGQFDSLVTGGTGSLDALLQFGPTDAWTNLDTAGFNN